MIVPKLLSSLVAVTATALLTVSAARAVDPGSQLIGCDQADNPVTVSVSSHLDPSCTWTRGVEIVASDVVLDCQGAHIVTTDRRTGILITTTTDVALSNITVRNCYIEGFLNNMRITREGFRDLAEGVEYENGYSNITVEDSTLMNSRGVGIFVDGYVTGVKLRNLHIEGAGSTGIYLEAGSKDNVVEDNEIVNNGYKENGPNGQFFDVGGSSIFFWGIGREGLAIDGSRNNTVINNTFSGNSAGAIFLYKNCGEFVNQRPERWWHRRYGADGNLIEGNTITGEDNGVWIASRMGENILPMDCSDPQYASGISLDYADANIVRQNVFTNVTFGVRVEDDHNVITDNQFIDDDAAHEAIVIGTRFRTPLLGLPVDDTTITGNSAMMAGNLNPYRWTNGHSNTTFASNQSLGRVVGLCEGEEPAHGPFVFVVQIAIADPDNPPVVDPPPTLPPPNVLPPCPLACASAAHAVQPSIRIKRLDTPPGDDTLALEGRMTVPHPFSPAIDPLANGVGIVVSDATGADVINVTVPGGAYDRATKVGWIASASGGKWKYLNRSATPTAGITRLIIKDLSQRQPGLVQFSVKGEHGSYAVDTANLPLAALVILDPPTAETGQCARAAFAGPAATCRADARSVKCN